MNGVERYLNNPDNIDLPLCASTAVINRFKVALERYQTVSKNHYDNISVMSTYWDEDTTGADLDSSLFIKTLSKLKNKGTSFREKVRLIVGDEDFLPTMTCALHEAKITTEKRKLFIFHYTGHAIAPSNTDYLLITPITPEVEVVENENGEQVRVIGKQVNMTVVVEGLKDLASRSPGLDILFVLDCCCSAIIGRGRLTKGERVEFMAATGAKGLANQRADGYTFTEHWCRAFDHFMELGQPFDCQEIRDFINKDRDLEQFPAVFVLREGWGVPITFGALFMSITPLPESANMDIIMVYHIREDNGSEAMTNLLKFIRDNDPRAVTVLASLPVSSTLLLLCVSPCLQQLLGYPQLTLITRRN